MSQKTIVESGLFPLWIYKVLMFKNKRTPISKSNDGSCVHDISNIVTLFKSYLHCKTFFSNKVARDVINEFFLKKNVSFSRYFFVFVKSTQIKIIFYIEIWSFLIVDMYHFQICLIHLYKKWDAVILTLLVID